MFGRNRRRWLFDYDVWLFSVPQHSLSSSHRPAWGRLTQEVDRSFCLCHWQPENEHERPRQGPDFLSDFPAWMEILFGNSVLSCSSIHASPSFSLCTSLPIVDHQALYHWCPIIRPSTIIPSQPVIRQRWRNVRVHTPVAGILVAADRRKASTLLSYPGRAHARPVAKRADEPDKIA